MSSEEILFSKLSKTRGSLMFYCTVEHYKLKCFFNLTPSMCITPVPYECMPKMKIETIRVITYFIWEMLQHFYIT
jgi:hypothetical protein